jgi:hypothetical protein
MALQNRVDPFGELIATPARGTIYGNRGGRFHRDDQTLGKRRWASRQWICCVVSFKGRHHPVWRERYTALFFLDEVTAFAAGHRPCFECRRADAKAFAEKWAQAKSIPVPHAPDMDVVLHQQRLIGRIQRHHWRDIDGLPDGVFTMLSDQRQHAFAVRGTKLLRWGATGYDDERPKPRGIKVEVLTPPAIVGVLAASYQPQWHPSADAF